MEEVFSIAQSQYSALILCMIAVYYFWRDKQLTDKQRYDTTQRHEERQNEVHKMMQDEIKDGIKKSHEQHEQIVKQCTEIHENINHKAKMVNQKIDLVLKLRSEYEDGIRGGE